ncbi:uncharacterized protein An16g08370 [Aspergillus niger]|uniref:Contig An16c0270, genomic contig n=2 Tax=Aspergillus niger TaxID=5061 RepID=A2R8U3_ASPNC|nr:uncharacterized protein An16g08370 [Aspergillus niger]CAK42936.1 unnamed protein product [Aspergillus niger]
MLRNSRLASRFARTGVLQARASPRTSSLQQQHPSSLLSSPSSPPTTTTINTFRLASTTTTTPPNDTQTTPDITNHYTIFKQTLPAGPPPSSPFNIPTADLRREFLRWQSLIHPDKYPQGPQKQQAEALSARINEAYRTLLDPLQRAQYLLREMHGIDVTAEDGASKHALDAETLMEVMEVQETIEEVTDSGEDAAAAEEKINELKVENQGRVEEDTTHIFMIL